MTSKQISEIKVRSTAALTSLDLGWLQIRDHFICTVGPNAGHGSPLGLILVLEDTIIQPQAAFPLHPHKDMEIITWVTEGVLHLRDNLGESVEMNAGSLQLLSARSGVIHSEGNHGEKPGRMLQMWIQPHTHGGEPHYSMTSLTPDTFQLLAASSGAPLQLRQEILIYGANFNETEDSIQIPDQHIAYGVSLGSLSWNDHPVQDGDGVHLGPGELKVQGSGQALILIQQHLK